MGLNLTHGCWDGAYSAFHRWRSAVAEAAGLPQLEEMDGYSPGTGISWAELKPDILHVLLNHSDCDGSIAAEFCGPLAERLRELLPELSLLPHSSGYIDDTVERTVRFIDGLEWAAESGEDVEFH